ncbi:MAG: hypothetical protein WCX31_11045 [Salinivirgaceae bacterium]
MKNIISFLLVFITLTSVAQDKIIKTNGDVITCTVSELGSDKIKYFYQSNPKIIFGIEKSLVDRVEFSTGEVVKMENNSFDNPDYYTNQSRRALKINFLSPLYGSTEFAYEQNIKPGKSFEAALGIVGLGFDPQENNPAGVYTKFAYKFIRTPDLYMNKMRYSHILKGAYIAPEFALRYMYFDTYDYDYYYPYNSSTKREDDFAIALMLKFGKQWVIDDSFLVDLYVGFGYGYSKAGGNGEGIAYGFATGGEEVPIAGTAGLRIGWVF